MRVTIHVPSADDIPAARTAVEDIMQEGDELEIIVAQPVPRMPSPAERQDAKPAGGSPANMGGA